MDPLSLTDEIIRILLECPKIIVPKRPRETAKAKHLERNVDVISADSHQNFTLITRQSKLITDNFSCGLLWHSAGGQG